MKLIFLQFILSIILSSYSYAIDIASCSSLSGKAYYPEIGLVSKEDSGWTDDKISGGQTKLTRTTEGEFDILYVDTTKEVRSSRADGGKVILLNVGENVVSLLVVYPGTLAEVYTFLENNSGNYEYIHVSSKAGGGVLFTKSSLMRGDCSYIDFSMFK